ncbi:unnamed protein product [Fusarium graminearum]|uniref:Uncharacterized protein n=1 Tax=Gibberella zeae TaxID=5518 RepID=A0A9N8RCD7_GIBZA|nr:unnamed protein product [Fusarium graminearum]
MFVDPPSEEADVNDTGYVRVWLKPEIFKCYRKSCELTKDEVYFSWGWGDDQNHGISYKTGEFGSFITGTIRDFPSGTPDLHNGNVSQAVCGTIICWEADQGSSEWYDKLILAMQELSRMAKSLAHDVGGGALNALIGQLPGFSQYADMMFWIENVAMVIGAFLEIFRNKDDKVAEHNYGFNREFLRRYQRPDSFIDFSFDGGSGGDFSLFARALIDNITMSSDSTAPEMVPDSDLIYPLHEFDDSLINRYMQHWTLRFDAVLDTKKLSAALTHLLSQGDWRKLGGRLQFNDTGKLEIHAPRKYTHDRPAFQFSEETFRAKTTDHPVAKNLPRARGKPELFPGITGQFKPLTLGPEWGLDFDEHVRRQEPVIGVHIALFDDATLISIRWSHVVCDFMGIKGLVLAWSMDLDGRYDEIPPFMGAYDDPLKDIGVSPKEPYALEHLKLNPEAFKKTYDLYLEHVEAYPETVRRMLVLPDSTVQKIKMDFIGGQSSDTLKVIPKGALYNGQFVSDADILSAWAARLCCGILPAADRPVHVMGMYEARHCLPETFPQRKDKPDSSPVFIANATFSTSTNTTLKALRQQPLARTALLVRESVATLTKAPQVHAQLHFLRESYEKDRDNPAIFAAEDSFILVVSNFSKMLFFDSIDFSSAVITPAVAGHGKSPGKIAWHQWTTLEHTTHMRNMFQVGGKDGQGNTWMMGLLPPEAWALAEKHLAGLTDRPLPSKL